LAYADNIVSESLELLGSGSRGREQKRLRGVRVMCKYSNNVVTLSLGFRGLGVRGYRVLV